MFKKKLLKKRFYIRQPKKSSRIIVNNNPRSSDADRSLRQVGSQAPRYGRGTNSSLLRISEWPLKLPDYLSRFSVPGHFDRFLCLTCWLRTQLPVVCVERSPRFTCLFFTLPVRIGLLYGLLSLVHWSPVKIKTSKIFSLISVHLRYPVTLGAQSSCGIFLFVVCSSFPGFHSSARCHTYIINSSIFCRTSASWNLITFFLLATTLLHTLCLIIQSMEGSFNFLFFTTTQFKYQAIAVTGLITCSTCVVIVNLLLSSTVIFFFGLIF